MSTVKIEEAITEYWGERCPDYEPECLACQAWGELDALKLDKQETLTGEEQEPVAWRRHNGSLHEFDPSDWADGPVTPLYTAPPKREWVGLTEKVSEADRLLRKLRIILMQAGYYDDALSIDNFLGEANANI